MKKIYTIVYCVDDDTEDKINEFDELDEVRDETANRSEIIASFDSKEAAEVYMERMGKTYDLMLKTGDELHYNVYNPKACVIEEVEILDLNDAKTKFAKDIEVLEKE